MELMSKRPNQATEAREHCACPTVTPNPTTAGGQVRFSKTIEPASFPPEMEGRSPTASLILTLNISVWGAELTWGAQLRGTGNTAQVIWVDTAWSTGYSGDTSQSCGCRMGSQTTGLCTTVVFTPGLRVCGKVL